MKRSDELLASEKRFGKGEKPLSSRISDRKDHKKGEVPPSPKRRIMWIESARKIVLFVSFILFNLGVLGVSPIPLPLPILEGGSSSIKTVGYSFDLIQTLFAKVIFPWLPFASIFLLSVIVGRATCGWLCPFGFVQDLLAYIKRKHSEVDLRIHNQMIKLKYLILAVTLFVSVTLAASLALGVGEIYKEAIGPFALGPFTAISPSDTLFKTLPNLILATQYTIHSFLGGPSLIGGVMEALMSGSVIFWARIIVMVLILLFAVYTPRSWCMYLCPLGALMAVFSRFSFLGLKRDLLKCTRAGCRICVEVCPMRVKILTEPWEKCAYPECIYCLKCVEACPERALSLKFS